MTDNCETKSPCAELNMFQFVTLREFITDKLKELGKAYTSSQIAAVMLTYEDIFPRGIYGMYCFWKWAVEHEMDEVFIVTNILHDFNGMRDTCFAPRTFSYGEDV